MQSFRDIKVWQKSYRLTLAVYRATATFPREEQFGLTSQLRRAASSVPANIAEGCCCDGDAEFARFLRIAMGSASELECHILLARDLGLLSSPVAAALETDVEEVKRMLSSFIRKLKAES